jgi:hypothetical protein
MHCVIVRFHWLHVTSLRSVDGIRARESENYISRSLAIDINIRPIQRTMIRINNDRSIVFLPICSSLNPRAQTHDLNLEIPAVSQLRASSASNIIVSGVVR